MSTIGTPVRILLVVIVLAVIGVVVYFTYPSCVASSGASSASFGASSASFGSISDLSGSFGS